MSDMASEIKLPEGVTPTQVLTYRLRGTKMEGHITPELVEVWQTLNQEQQDAFVALIPPLQSRRPRHVFVTGSAGTGKSYWLTVVLKFLKCVYPNIAVTGMTGRAAGCITSDAHQATTLHHIIPLCKTLKQSKKVLSEKPLQVEYLRSLHLIVIDEVSMLRAFDAVTMDQLLRTVLGAPAQTMGGLTFLFVGDLKQIPPVCPDEEKNIPSKAQFFFENTQFYTSMFGENSERVFIFKQNFRQSGDAAWAGLLERVGTKTMTPEDVDVILDRCTTNPPESAIHVYPHLKEVEERNERCFNALPGEVIKLEPVVEYVRASDTVRTADLDAVAVALFAEYEIPRVVKVKRGARVILGTNINVSEGQCNGACFFFVGVERQCVLVVRREEDLNNRAQYIAIPPKLWIKRVPPLGEVTIRMHVYRLGYASTVHGIQGITLDQIAVKVDRAFMPGMVYVALSRVRRLEDLYVIGFDVDKVTIADCVRAFYTKLAVIDQKRQVARAKMYEEISQEVRKKAIEEAERRDLLDLVHNGLLDEFKSDGEEEGISPPLLLGPDSPPPREIADAPPKSRHTIIVPNGSAHVVQRAVPAPPRAEHVDLKGKRRAPSCDTAMDTADQAAAREIMDDINAPPCKR
jgi:ATP-dependent DNA helicase PIF1